MTTWRLETTDEPTTQNGRTTWTLEGPSNFTGDGGVKKSKTESFFSGAADSASFGFGDELLGLTGGVQGLWDGRGYDTAKDQITEWSRQQQRLAASDNPFSYGGGQLAGAVAGGFGVGAGARGLLGGTRLARSAMNAAGKAGPMTRIGATAGAGALGGALYGAASEEGDAFSRERLGGAASGAAFGAAAGGALGVIGEPIRHMWMTGIKPSFSSNTQVANLIADAQRRFGFTAQDLDKAVRNAPKNATLMDVIPGAIELVKGAGIRPGIAAKEFRDFLNERNNAMSGEIGDRLWKSFTGSKKNRVDIGSRIQQLHTERKATVGPLYDEIDEGFIEAPAKDATDWIEHQIGVKGSIKLDELDDDAISSVGGKQYGRAIRNVIAEMMDGDALQPGGLIRAGQEVDLNTLYRQPRFWRRVLEEVQNDLQDSIKQATSPLGVKRGSAVRQEERMVKHFRKTIGEMLGDKFENAQAVSRKFHQEADALELGYRAITGQGGDLRLAPMIEAMNKMTDEQRQHVVRGAVGGLEDLMNRADTGTGYADVLRAIVGNKEKVIKLNHILGKVKDANRPDKIDGRTKIARLLKDIDQQRQLFRNSVETGIGVNSQTAEKLFAANDIINRTGGSDIKSSIWKAVFGESRENFNEDVSNEVIRLLGRPVREVQDEIANAGGLANWLKQAKARSLLAQSQARAADVATHRQQALLGTGNPLSNRPGALLMGLYANAGFADPLARASQN